MKAFTRIAVSTVSVLVLITVSATCSRAQDAPDAIAGRWVVESYSINGKLVPEYGRIPQMRDGCLWKLYDDGTGSIASFKQKWTYDKQKRSFTISQEGIIYGYGEWITDADVSKRDKIIIFKWTNLGINSVLELKPEPK